MISGIVVEGDHIARTYGFPTANLDIQWEDIQYEEGIYSSYTTVNGHIFPSALCIDRKREKCEVHLFGYEGEPLYGKKLDVEVKRKVSEFETIQEGQEMKEKIEQDIQKVKADFDSRSYV